VYTYRFTVFTPTFNRVSLLPRLYESLQQQTYRDFEWLIIDDGSTDLTTQIAEEWKGEGLINLRYIWQENAGKHMAFNRAIREAQGELLLAIDSDDALLPKSLEIFSRHWDDIQTLPADQAAKFSGVTGLCQDQFGNVYGDQFPSDAFDSDANEIRYKYRTKGEKKGFHKTDVHKQFPFPALKDHKFVPESIVWNAIGQNYKTRFVNDIVRVYWSHDEERLTTGHFDPVMSPGHALWHRDILNTNMKYFRYSPESLIKSAVHYSRFSFHAGDSIITQWKQLESFPARALWAVTIPLGWYTYLKENGGRSSRAEARPE